MQIQTLITALLSVVAIAPLAACASAPTLSTQAPTRSTPIAPAPAQTTQSPIAQANRNQQTTVSGEIVQIRDDEFVLNAGNQQIIAEADDDGLRRANLTVGQQVTVVGRFEDDGQLDVNSITRAGENTPAYVDR